MLASRHQHKKKEMEAQVKTIVEAGDRTLEQADAERGGWPMSTPRFAILLSRVLSSWPAPDVLAVAGRQRWRRCVP